MKCSRPGFLGLGVQKGGTTSLYRLLTHHPGVFLPQWKELHYFSLHHGLGDAWYADFFAKAKEDQCAGEITPYYIFHPLAPGRIKALVPHVKLIVLLRDPVERALSQLFHSQRLGLEPLELEEALAAEAERLALAEPAVMAGERHPSHQEHSYLARSRYELQLARYQALFPAEQLLLLRSEDLFADTQSIWVTLQTFLGLDIIPLLNVPRANSGNQEAQLVSAELRQQLRQRLRMTYEVMAEQYGLHWT
ncbi:sulfotransferase [Prochlorococcus sp. MIT 1303]|uniref:sulfotransferase family protein n=1 Tax=Prochlorococcus sp. MIT 1303 TaxID=1723647 RepID=UPI0007B3C2C1|nr:sulfotransferase domain-containing protein [Prochlorococcus sp. MIT 1303]KZR61793.1 Sulfotransferase domain protein [Prochlorococcus sp. MIT 1303]